MKYFSPRVLQFVPHETGPQPVHSSFFRVRPDLRINRVETKTCGPKNTGLLDP